MRVSYINRIEDSTLSATNEDLNRPVTNLNHNFLELAFYSNTNESVITATLDNIYDIDHVCYGYHNLSELHIDFYDGGNNLVESFYDVEIIPGENIIYFDTILNVKKIIFSCYSDDPLLYVGTFFAGEYFELPNFQQAPPGNIRLSDSRFQTAGGQASGNRKKDIDDISLNFLYITNAERKLIKLYASSQQGSRPHFIDLNPDAHDEEQPFYGVIDSTEIQQDRRRLSNFRYNMNIAYKKSR